MRKAMTIGTPWTDEVNEHISDACGSGKWLGNYTNRDELTFTEQWLRRDHRNQQQRLERTVMTTTGLYKELTLPDSVI